MYQLTSAVPIPATDAHYHRGNPKYPFAGMKVGDSFSVPISERRLVATAVTKAAKRLGMKFTVRKFEGAAHCWRIA